MIGGPGTQSTEKSQYFSKFPLGNFTSNLLVENKLLQGMQEKYKHSLYFSFNPILTIALLLAPGFRYHNGSCYHNRFRYASQNLHKNQDSGGPPRQEGPP